MDMENMGIVNNISISLLAKYVGLTMLQRGISVSPLKLQKILYYIQSWHMVFFGRENTLVAEAPHAWVNGPVYPQIYREYKNCVPGMCDHLSPIHFGVDDIDKIPEVAGKIAEELAFSDDQIQLIDSVIKLYGAKTQNQLIFATHCEDPWCEMREGLRPYEKSDAEMSLDTMYRYYKDRYDRNRSKE